MKLENVGNCQKTSVVSFTYEVRDSMMLPEWESEGSPIFRGSAPRCLHATFRYRQSVALYTFRLFSSGRQVLQNRHYTCFAK
jgi:hypothetical protein